MSDRPRPPHRRAVGQAPVTADEWYTEAEVHLREAARRLEVVGLVDGEAARMALVIYRLASRVRSDRLAVAS